MRTTTTVILALAAVLLAVFAFWENRSARQARTALDTAISERDALRERVASLEEAQETLAAEAVQLRADAAAQPKLAADAARQTRPFTNAIPPGRMPPPMAMMDSPEIRALMQLEQKGRLDGRYAALFAALRLPPDKLENLKQLLVDKQNAMMDVLAVAHRQNLFESGTPPDLRAMARREQDAIDANIHELLGDTAFEEYQEYERTRAQRGVVDQLASRLSYTDEPLLPRQSQALVDLLAAEKSTASANPAAAATTNAHAGVRVAFSAGGADTMVAFGPPGFNGDTASITDASVSAAESVLTAAQLAALQQIQAEQQAQQRMGDLMRQSMPQLQRGRPGTATWVSAPAGAVEIETVSGGTP